MNVKASEALASAEVRDVQGRAQPLRALWRERPALILWVRHFG